jgi:acetylornithine deacetylase/succinyl-diaminopimelate desuccinylase-like protein
VNTHGPTGEFVAPALAYARANGVRFVADLKRLVSFASVSSAPRLDRGVDECASWLARRLQAAGFDDVEVVQTLGQPIVRAGWHGARARPTLLVYAHYDVQPPEPLEAWRTPPFQPTIREGFLYGRGASDDKGPLLAHVAALEAYLRGAGALPVNVECVFEGEEEIGSPHLADFLRSHRDRLRADVALVSDTRMRARDQPAITYALRGALAVELEFKGPPRELHSGQFGGAIRNPLERLCEVVAGLSGCDGRIAIPGFYDRVRPGVDAERDHMRHTGPSDAEILRDAGVAAGTSETGYSLYEQTTLRPSMTVSGIAGGYAGPGVKGVIPARAVAKLGFRLVPDQDPRQVEALLRRYSARAAPDVHVRVLSRARPTLVDLRQPAIRAAAAACHRVFGTEPAYLRSGGTIPVVSLFEERLQVSTVLLGFALANDGTHAPNERFLLRNLERGIQTSIWFLDELARAQRAAPPRAPVLAVG